MNDRSERSAGREQTGPAGGVEPSGKPPARPRRRAGTADAPRPQRPPNALGPFVPEASVGPEASA
jgi:hypothetical protein